jgi:hypothetical protein
VQTLETVGERDLVAPGFELAAVGDEGREAEITGVREGSGEEAAAGEGQKYV